MRYARLVIGCKPFAAAASFAALAKKAEEDMCQMLRTHIEGMVKELRGPDDRRRAFAEAQLETVINLNATLFSEAEAERLRRRAALGTPAA